MTKKINRSAKTGEFVSKKFAKQHPATTVSESVETGKKFFTYIPADYSLRNSLHKQIFAFLQENSRKVIPASEIFQFKMKILAGINRLNHENKKCHPLEAHWQTHGKNEEDSRLWLGVGVICWFDIYTSN
jgi:hypothetical protein